MNFKKFLKFSTIILFFIFLLNYLALKFYWYSSIWYFDMLMHFMGGIWLGFMSIYLLKIDDFCFKNIIKILFLVFFVSIGWEIFEIFVNLIFTKNSFNFLDTVSDLFFDMAGGMFSIFYFIKKIMPIKENSL